MAHTVEHLRLILNQLYGISRRTVKDLENLEYVDTGYKTDHTPPAEGWKPYDLNNRFTEPDKHYWFRTHFSTPSCDENHQLFLTMNTGKEERWIAVNPQGLLYLNGYICHGFDTNHTEAFIEPNKEYDMLNYFYVGNYEGVNEGGCWFRMFVREADKRVEKLYWDIRVALEAALLPSVSTELREKVLDILQRVVARLDLRAPRSEAFFTSLADAQNYLDAEYYEKLCSTEGKPIVTCLGHTHIDVEWQWTRFQTREKIQRSFAIVKELMEHYPEYRFMLSQPQLYQYLKEEAPDKYEELKQLQKEGRWEPEGAMYLEADCNLISGESFIRQIMHGKKFFKDEFGVDSQVLFLPDVFGYSAALPQILKKSGVKHFVTSKISWNDTNTLPVDTFLWQGIDGTEIFTNFLTAQNDAVPPARETSYVGMMNATQVKGGWHRYQQKEYANQTIQTFGYGDGGGGPSKEMLEHYRRLAKGLPEMPVAKMGFLLPHLEEVRRQFDENCKRIGHTPRWVGELYLEFHRGTYTSIAKNKRGNRKSEFLLQKAETLSAIDLLNGGTYDADGLYREWEKVLHNQFHDIIPGSSIHEVYELTDKDYAEIAAYGNGVVDEKLSALAKNIRTQGGVMVYNPLGFAHKGIVTVDGQTVETEEIPAFGWKVLPAVSPRCGVTVKGNTAESDLYILTVDGAGRVVRLYDKKNAREVLAGKGNELQIFEDLPQCYDNWEIGEYYKQKKWILDGDTTVETVTDGDRAGFKVVKKYFSSTITQHIWLYTENPRIDFETHIDWHEHHQLLKVAFPLDVQTMSATYEIQYGHVSRPTHENTSWEQAKFEVYGHKWVDMSDHSYGVALLNDCKYGHNIEGNTLKLTMLRCGTFPDTEADQGEHILTYSLLPHAGNVCEAGVIQEAYLLNQPMSAAKVSACAGTLPETFSLVSCDKENVILEVVKKAEADNSLIVRLYEAYDQRTTATLTLPEGITKVTLCDLLENALEDLPVVDGTVTFPVKNYEIITLKLDK